MSLRTSSSKDWLITVGPSPMVRLGDPGFEVKMNSKDEIKVGSSGEGTIIKNPDRSGTIMIHLMADSESNAVLAAYRSAHKLNPNGFVVPVLIKSAVNTSTVFAAQALIANDPDLSNPKADAPDVVWELISDDIEIVPGVGLAPSGPA